MASVAAPHGAEAFAACALLVDSIKERTPIWKRQHLEGGTTEWVESLTQRALGSASACRRTAPGVCPIVRANARVKAASDW